MKKTVAIVGRAKETRALAPFDDRSVDIWAFNYYAYQGCPRIDACFEMHPDALTCDRYDDGYLNWLRSEHPFPIWLHPDSDGSGIPSGRIYPLRDVSERFEFGVLIGGERKRNFFTSSPAYALGLAMLNGYERIEMYGIEMNPLTEYAEQANCWYFWMGKASALGYEIVVHPQSRLFSQPMYMRKKEA